MMSEEHGPRHPDAPRRRERERWSSRTAFYFAAAGAAVGFGNVWRFPSLVYEYGGGAFFVPYLFALVLIGLPILVLEISLGQYYETGDVDVFGGINKRLRGVGLGSIACGYIGLTYYSMLLSWVTHAFFDSFGKDNFWVRTRTSGELTEYFEDSIIGMNTLPDDLEPTRLVWKNVGYSIFTWVVVYICIAFGIRWTGRITYFTMGMPTILLFILLARTVTLEGSQEGIRQYLSSDWSALYKKPEMWTKAVGQILFSLGINIGIMTAYASHCHRDEPAFMNACVLAALDSLFSFISGFAVFAALGYLAVLEDTNIADLKISGFGLVFGSWPAALGTLPGGEHWIRLLFLMLFLLGIDSAFCVAKGFLIVLRDTVLLGDVKERYISLGLASTAWLFSLIYATDAGLIFMDTMDYYINFVLILAGFAECFAAGWMYNLDEQVDNLGGSIVFSFMATYFGSIFLACILRFSIADRQSAVLSASAGWVIFSIFGMGFVCYQMRERKNELGLWSWKSMFYDLALRNVMDLRADLSGIVGYLPVAWAILIKFIIPPVLLLFFSYGCNAKTSTGQTEFGHYGGYPLLPYQMLGVSSIVFVGFLFVSSVIMPQLYDGFQKSDSPVFKESTPVATELVTRSCGAVESQPPRVFEISSSSTVALSLNSAPNIEDTPPRSINVQV